MVKSEGLRRRVTPIAAALLLAALLAVLVLLWGERPAEAAFPGANGLIAYEKERCCSEAYILTINADGTDEEHLPGADNIKDKRDPAWSPDGQKIAFSGGVWEQPQCCVGDHEIYIMDSNGEQLTRLTNNASSEEFAPTWSPDGQKIAFVSDRDGDLEIYVMDTDPSTDDAIKLTNNTVDDSDPAWSPDGKKIAFVSDRDGDEEIYVMDTDPSTKDTTRITKNDTWDESPDWSPNGQKIAFEGYPGILVVKNSDGTGRKRLPYGSEPAWSPDGRKIAFIRVVSNGEWGPERELFVMNKDGSGVQRLTGYYDHYSPTWQPIVR